MMLLLTAALAQMSAPVMRVPPPATSKPFTRSVDSAIPTTSQALPDFVVKDIRIEGDRIIHVQVANEGLTDAPSQIAVSLSASASSYRTARASDVLIPPLKAGETAWVVFPALYARTTDGIPGSEVVTLPDIQDVTATIDPSVLVPSGWSAGTNVAQTVPGLCKLKGQTALAHGCIFERDDTNNSLRMNRDKLLLWSE